MSRQWEIDIIVNVWFTCIMMKLSCTFYPYTPIKTKIGGKILSQKQAFIANFQFSKIYVEGYEWIYSPGSF